MSEFYTLPSSINTPQVSICKNAMKPPLHRRFCVRSLFGELTAQGTGMKMKRRFRMGVLTMTVDIHGMTAEQAKRLLLQKIDRLPKDYGQIIVIHGYHAGNRLQTMVRKELKHTRLKRRILTMNAGETILIIE